MVNLRNRYTNRLLLHDSSGALSVAPPGPELSTATWTQQTVDGTEFVRLCDPSDASSCLNIEHGPLVVGQVQPGWLSAMWNPEPITGTSYVRYTNRWKPSIAIHAESGTIEAGEVQSGWWSAMWAVDLDLIPDARSVHLNYGADDASAFAIECTAVESQLGTYFCAAGFGGGYIGMQETADGSKMMIFSIWDGDDGATPQLIAQGTGVSMQGFSGEGTGVSARLGHNWTVNRAVSFAVTAKAVGKATQFSGYFKDNDAWTLLATIERSATNGALLGGLYSFVEDFLRNGAVAGISANDRSPYQHHVGNFSNPWARSSDGSWSSLNSATFSAWSPQPLENIDATAPAGSTIVLQLATGGFWVPHTQLGATVTSSGSPTAAPTLPES